MSRKTELIHAMIEPELFKKIEKERGRETRSSFVRRILVKWYDQVKTETDETIEE